ncbi:MAG: hypothetical protein PHQ69_04325 [Bacteroidales bacterium]|nr:hypothetical protein [Bacteroidales bacterium]
MKNLLFLLLLVLMSVTLHAQIGGISGSKLNAVCVDVVDHHHLEFEPAFGISWQSKAWDNHSSLSSHFPGSDSTYVSSGALWRFTYGLFDQLEIGVTAPLHLDVLNFGLRYVVYQGEKAGIAAIAGFNMPVETGIVSISPETEAQLCSLGIGAVASYAFNDHFSIDGNVQYLRYTATPTDSRNSGLACLAIDAGYYLLDHQFQVIAGLGYQNHFYPDDDHALLTLYPGVTIETGQNYIIVLAAPYDLFGKNFGKSIGFNFALTLTMN